MNSEVAIRVPGLASGDSWLREQAAKWNRDLKFLIRQTRIITLLLRHPAVPWHAKLVAACTVGYLFSPIQLIPSFIPVIGQLDDVAVLLTGMKLLRRLTPKAALAECESKAATLVDVQRDWKTIFRRASALPDSAGGRSDPGLACSF